MAPQRQGWRRHLAASSLELAPRSWLVLLAVLIFLLGFAVGALLLRFFG